MNQAIEKRVIKEAEYIAQHGATVRQTARVFAVSKSTVHKDMETRLPQLSGPLFQEVAAVFAKNKAERHLRGGEATRRRYAKLPDSTTMNEPLSVLMQARSEEGSLRDEIPQAGYRAAALS